MPLPLTTTTYTRINYQSDPIAKIIILDQQYEDTFNLLITVNSNDWQVFSRCPLTEKSMREYLNEILDKNPNAAVKTIKNLRISIPNEWYTHQTKIHF